MSGRFAARIIERPEISAYKFNTCASSACSNLTVRAGICFSPAAGGSKLLNVRAPAVRTADLGSGTCFLQPEATKAASNTKTNNCRAGLLIIPNQTSAAPRSALSPSQRRRLTGILGVAAGGDEADSEDKRKRR